MTTEACAVFRSNINTDPLAGGFASVHRHQTLAVSLVQPTHWAMLGRTRLYSKQANQTIPNKAKH